MPATAGQENGGLARRIAAADDDDFLVLAQLGFEMGGSVVNAGADEFRQVRDARFAVLRTRRNDDGAGLHHTAVGQFQRVGPPLAEQARCSTGDVDVGAELLRLHQRTAGECHARDAGREAEIIFNP